MATQGVPSRGKAEVDLAVAADGGSKCVVVESLDDLKVIQYDAGPPPETDEESQQREKEQETKRAASKRAISRRPLKKQARGEKTQYRVDRLLARQEINGVDSYLVQWSGYTHEYTDWIPAADVTVRAIEMFNPPPGAPGEHTESMAAARAELKEWSSTRAGGIINVDDRGKPHYDKQFFIKMINEQSKVLYRRRCKRLRPKYKVSHKGPLPAASRPHLKRRADSADSSGEDDIADSALNDSSSISDNQSTIDSLMSQKRAPAPAAKKVKSRPTVEMVNSFVLRFWEQTVHAAKAIVNYNKVHNQAHGDPSAVSSLGVAVEEAIGALGLPKKLKQYHSKKQLALCLRSPPTVSPTELMPNGEFASKIFKNGIYYAPIFEEIEGKMKCICGGDPIFIASMDTAKRHLISRGHLQFLHVTRAPGSALGFGTLNKAAAHHGRDQVELHGLRNQIVYRAVVMAAQRRLPFTAASDTLRFGQSILYDVTGEQLPSQDVISDLQRSPKVVDHAAADALEKIDSEKFGSVISRLRQSPTAAQCCAAKQLQRLRVLTRRNQRNQHGDRPPLHLDRTGIARALRTEIEPAVDRLTNTLLKKCPYVALLLDESKSNSLTDPCYIGVQYCTPSFEWGLHLVGQTDTSIQTAGVDLLIQVRHKFGEAERSWLFDKILFGSTDGCHAMRSTRQYAGLHPRREGKSFLKRLQDELRKKRDPQDPYSLSPDVLFTHCVAHVIALAFKDACEVLPVHVMPHLRSFHAKFHNGLKEWAELKALCNDVHADMKATNALLDNPIDNLRFYRATRFKSLSPTRWKDLLRVVESIVNKWAALRALRDRRIDQGFGVPTNDDDNWTSSTKPTDLPDSDDDDKSDDTDGSSSDDSDDANELDINGIRKKDKFGGVTVWKDLGRRRCTGHSGAHPVADAHPPTRDKRTTLLSDALGVTPLNHTINSFLADALAIHVGLVKQLETRKQPIAHLIARWIQTYHRKLKTVYVDGCGDETTYGAMYKTARAYYLDDRAGNEPEIVAAVDELACTFASALITSSQERLKPYMPMFKAFELADPSMSLPNGDGRSSVWDMAKLLCKTTGIDFETFQNQCCDMHIAYDAFATDDKKNCKGNLLRFYKLLTESGQMGQWNAVAMYARAVFTFPVTTVFIECLFSAMNGTKTKQRSSMLDDTCIAVIKCAELTRVLTSTGAVPEPELRLADSIDHNIHGNDSASDSDPAESDDSDQAKSDDSD